MLKLCGGSHGYLETLGSGSVFYNPCNLLLLEEMKEQLLVCRGQCAMGRLDHLMRTGSSKADTELK